MKSMTVGELIKILQDYGPDDEVLFTYDFGDHWNTQVAAPIAGVHEGLILPPDGQGSRRVG